jgi:hypothetical protein
MDNNFSNYITFVCQNVAIYKSIENLDVIELINILETSHPNGFRVYYFSNDQNKFNHSSLHKYPFNSHNPCSMDLILQLCESIELFLSLNSDHIIIFYENENHSYNKSYFLCCCYLLHCRFFSTTIDVMNYLNDILSLCNHHSIISSSQIRYIKYYEYLLKHETIQMNSYKITSIKLNGIPSFEKSIVHSGCLPFVIISLIKSSSSNSLSNNNNTQQTIIKFHQKDKALNTIKKWSSSHDHYITFEIEKYAVNIRGDVNISIFNHDYEKMCSVTFHTGFIDDNFLSFEKSTVDMAANDIYDHIFPHDFHIEISLHKIRDMKREMISNPDDIDFTCIPFVIPNSLKT